jgi:general secretion pathway protein B
MSYILDALRRAETERDRGQVPGLHTQAVPVGLGEGESAHKGGLGLKVAAGAAAVLLLGLLAWWWSRPAVPAEHAAASTAAPQASPTMPGAPLADMPARSPAANAAGTPANSAINAGPPLLVAPPVPAVPAAAPAARPVRPAASAPEPNPESSAAAAVSATAPAAPPATPTAAIAAPAPTEAPRAPSRPAAGSVKPTLLSDLPAGQRSELPQMLIGGAIYSDQPASRFVVINGLVVREGETAAPGVTLERIGPKSAIVRWREMRIELPI